MQDFIIKVFSGDTLKRSLVLYSRKAFNDKIYELSKSGAKLTHRDKDSARFSA